MKLLLLFLLFVTISVSDKGYIKSVRPDLILLSDSVNKPGKIQTFKKTFTDKNGENTVEVNILNPCVLATPPWDAEKCTIEASFKSRKERLKLFYDYPHAQMSLIYFNGKEIQHDLIKGAMAVFIPFYYCGNSEDYDRKVSYIIFYNRKKYLYHIDYTCIDELSCEPKVNPSDQFRALPPVIKNYFIKYLYHKHRNRKSFHQDY